MRTLVIGGAIAIGLWVGSLAGGLSPVHAAESPALRPTCIEVTPGGQVVITVVYVPGGGQVRHLDIPQCPPALKLS